MATIKATLNKTVTLDESVAVLTWSGLTLAGDVGDAQSFANFSDKTFIASGNFAGTPTIVIQGCNDQVLGDWVTLSNRQGTAMSFTTLGMNTSQDRPVFVRPLVTVGTGGGAVVITCACHHTDLPANNN